MSSNCNSDCSSCSSKCSQAIPKEKLHELSTVKKVYAVVSGKGGVGKSLVTSMMAVAMQRKGLQTAILDADITGPSIPKSFGIKGRAKGNELGLLPSKTGTGIDIMSVNLLLNSETDPVVWRGPVIAGTVKQFWSEVIWKDEDVMFIDMPPGTGDVPLTVFQSLPIDGIIIVTSPQELVSMIVEKAVKMANIMNIPIVGIVENMSYFECPSCSEKHYIYGESKLEKIAEQYKIENIARIPIDPEFAAGADRGEIEAYAGDFLDSIADALETDKEDK